jgi:hypothetical protein
VFGFSFAMNDRLSFSTALTATFSSDVEAAGRTIERDEEYDLRFALTGLLAEALYVEPSIAFGLDGPDDRVRFGLSLPYSFGRGTHE